KKLTDLAKFIDENIRISEKATESASVENPVATMVVNVFNATIVGLCGVESSNSAHSAVQKNWLSFLNSGAPDVTVKKTLLNILEQKLIMMLGKEIKSPDDDKTATPLYKFSRLVEQAQGYSSINALYQLSNMVHKRSVVPVKRVRPVQFSIKDFAFLPLTGAEEKPINTMQDFVSKLKAVFFAKITERNNDQITAECDHLKPEELSLLQEKINSLPLDKADVTHDAILFCWVNPYNNSPTWMSELKEWAGIAQPLAAAEPTVRTPTPRPR
ncbi:MAG: hypothetical protein V4490_01845, partial [Pseudomonadota bacterium]